MLQQYSRIVQGCMTWGVWGKQLSKNEMISTIDHCMENGITTFDHADIYGDYTTEKEFGKALAEVDIPREDMQLISKCGIQYIGKTRNNEVKHYQYDADYIIKSAEKSIKDLGANFLDLFLLHRPSPLMHPDEVAKAVDSLVSEGKIKAFGVSNFTPSQTDLISKRSHICMNQIEFSLTHFEAMHNGSLDHMMISGITPMCWSPLGKVFKTEDEQTRRIHILLEVLSQKYNATKDQLLLAWILKHPSGIHPVIGTTNKERISNATKADSIALTDVDWFKMLVESQGYKVP
jgi:predicted oxidoreductase